MRIQVTNKQPQKITVDDQLTGRIDKALATVMSDVSRSQLKNGLRMAILLLMGPQ